MNILKELWYGNIIPQEAEIYNTPELHRQLEIMSQYHEELENTLTDTQRTLLNTYIDSMTMYESLAQVAVFEYAFKLGGQFMAEMMRTDICPSREYRQATV